MKIGEGSMIISGTVINTNSKNGKYCLINTRSIIDQDNTWEDFSSSGPGVSSAESVKIKKIVFIMEFPQSLKIKDIL